MEKTNWTPEMEEAYQQNLAKLRLQLELDKAIEEIRKENRNPFLQLIDESTLENLLDYYSGIKNDKSYEKAYQMLKDEYKIRVAERNSGNNF